MCPGVKKHGSKNWEYIIVYVDDQLPISKNAAKTVELLQKEPFYYRMKDVGEPKQ
jgi:hypothetical protein